MTEKTLVRQATGVSSQLELSKTVLGVDSNTVPIHTSWNDTIWYRTINTPPLFWLATEWENVVKLVGFSLQSMSHSPVGDPNTALLFCALYAVLCRRLEKTLLHTLRTPCRQNGILVSWRSTLLYIPCFFPWKKRYFLSLPWVNQQLLWKVRTVTTVLQPCIDTWWAPIVSGR